MAPALLYLSPRRRVNDHADLVLEGDTFSAFPQKEDEVLGVWRGGPSNYDAIMGWYEETG
jgi:hypothetical protein